MLRSASLSMLGIVMMLSPCLAGAERIESAFGISLCEKYIPTAYEEKIEIFHGTDKKGEDYPIVFKNVKPPLPNAMFQNYDVYLNNKGRVINITGKILVDKAQKMGVCRDLEHFFDAKYGQYSMVSDDGVVKEPRNNKYTWGQSYRTPQGASPAKTHRQVMKLSIDQCDDPGDYIQVRYFVDSGCKDDVAAESASKPKGPLKLAILPFLTTGSSDLVATRSGRVVVDAVEDVLDSEKLFVPVYSAYEINALKPDDMKRFEGLKREILGRIWRQSGLFSYPEHDINVMIDVAKKVNADAALSIYASFSDMNNWQMSRLTIVIVDANTRKSFIENDLVNSYYANWRNLVVSMLRKTINNCKTGLGIN